MPLQLYFVDHRKLARVGSVAGADAAELARSPGGRLIPDGMPIVLDEAMAPVEPLSSWLRQLAMARRSRKTMRTYGYAALRLHAFLVERQRDLLTATESDLFEYRLWRLEQQEDPIDQVTWEKESSAISSLYRWLTEEGLLARRPWRSTGRREALRGGVSRDPRVRHLELDQYLFLRDVGFGGLTPEAGIDESFRGNLPHRNRAALEVALLTGMRLQEWSTLLLPELGIAPGSDRCRSGDFEIEACAKQARRRTVYVPRDGLDLVDSYLMLERAELVERAQGRLKRRRAELFMVDRIDERGRLHGRLDGTAMARVMRTMPPELRAVTVFDTGTGLEPLALFLAPGGRMLSASAWDRVRWRAWSRLQAWAGHESAPALPRHRWLYHDMRHTFALRLLIYLTREALCDTAAQGMPMATLLEHMTYNPLLTVQARLGHASPATTYRYIRYLKDPMRDVTEAFREWTAAGGASYASIAASMLELPEVADASAR